MIEVKESFYVPSIAGGPYEGGQRVDLGDELEEQLIAAGKAERVEGEVRSPEAQ